MDMGINSQKDPQRKRCGDFEESVITSGVPLRCMTLDGGSVGRVFEHLSGGESKRSSVRALHLHLEGQMT
ncbi:hypothetical protein ACLOJK_011630 [Asimina triloba]